MPIKKPKKSGVDLSAIIEGLLNADIEFILVGGLAAVIQGAPVTTMDVDIVHKQSADNISKLFKFLRSINAIHRRPDSKIIEPKIEDISAMGHLLLTTRLGPLDVLAFIEEKKTYDDLFESAIDIEFRGRYIHVLDIRTLTDLKRKSNLPKDKQRLAVLEETVKQLTKERGK